MKTETTDIIKKINEELQSGKTKKYTNYIDMGMLNEQFAINETLKTASILQEVDKQDTQGLKKAYNFRLVDMLEVQEQSWEVCAEFRNGNNDPSRFAL